MLGLLQQHRGILSDPESKPRWRNHVSLSHVRRKFRRLLLFFNSGQMLLFALFHKTRLL